MNYVGERVGLGLFKVLFSKVLGKDNLLERLGELDCWKNGVRKEEGTVSLREIYYLFFGNVIKCF